MVEDPPGKLQLQILFAEPPPERLVDDAPRTPNRTCYDVEPLEP